MDLFNSISEELNLVEQSEGLTDPRIALNEIPIFISETDNEGSIWPKGLFQHLCNNNVHDSRYLFMSRFSRSAFFGELLVKEYANAQFGICNDEIIECGRLLNMFITAFDAVCDDITEELPATLNVLSKVFSVFPNQVESKNQIEYNLTGFTLSLAYEIAERLGGAMGQFEKAQQVLFTAEIVGAFKSQVKELSVGMVDADAQTSIIDSKSIGPFAVSMIIPHLLLGESKETECIQPVSKAMGRLFGWIDDLADWKEDKLAEKTTSLNIFLNKKSVIEADLIDFSTEIKDETTKRYQILSNQLYKYNLIEMDTSLKSAMIRWLIGEQIDS